MLLFSAEKLNFHFLNSPIFRFCPVHGKRKKYRNVPEARVESRRIFSGNSRLGDHFGAHFMKLDLYAAFANFRRLHNTEFRSFPNPFARPSQNVLFFVAQFSTENWDVLTTQNWFWQRKLWTCLCETIVWFLWLSVRCQNVGKDNPLINCWENKTSHPSETSSSIPHKSSRDGKQWIKWNCPQNCKMLIFLEEGWSSECLNTDQE